MYRKIINASFGSFTILVSFLIGFIFENVWLSVMMSFGALIFLYYVPTNKENTFKQLYIVFFICLISFFISAISSQLIWISFIWIGILAFVLNYLLSIIPFKGPGIFFILMINAMIAGLSNFTMEDRLLYSSFATLGVVLAIIFGIIENYIFDQYPIKYASVSFKKIDSNLLSRSLFNSIFIFTSYYIAYNIHLPNFYWVLVGTTTILQAEHFKKAYKKQVDYILACLFGSILSLLLYVFVVDIIWIAIISSILFGLICYIMPKSYLLGNIFTTPIALLLFKATDVSIDNTLIFARFLDLLIGTSIGLIGILVITFMLNIDGKLKV